MRRLRNALAELLFRFGDWLRERPEQLADMVEDLSERLYMPEVDAKQSERKRRRE